MKKSGLIGVVIVLSLCLLLSVSFVSASWFGDFWGKITGYTVGDNSGSSNVSCGNGICEEDCNSCSIDCGSCSSNGYCGDNICKIGETYSTCARDCAAGSYSCIDSDDGLNYYVKGNTNGWNDTCFYSGGDQFIDEGFCHINGSMVVYHYLCPGGCQDGACLHVAEPPASCSENYTFEIKRITSEDIYDYLTLEEWNSGLSMEFRVGQTKSIDNLEITATSISDDNKTAVLSVKSPGVFDYKAKRDDTYETVNSTVISLNESNDDYFVVSYCSQTQTCIDSDGGLDYYVKGNTTFYTPEGYFDGLAIDTCRGVYNVAEFYCSPQGLDNYSTTYTCPNGCQDGACMPPEYTQITSVNVIGEDSNTIKLQMKLAENIPAIPEKYIGYVFALDTDKNYNTPGQFTANDIGNDYNARVYFEENDQQWHATVDVMGTVTSTGIPPAYIFDVSGNTVTMSVPKSYINYADGFYLVGTIAFESGAPLLPYPSTGHISYPAEDQICSSLIDAVKNPQSTSNERKLSWNSTYYGSIWINNQEEKYTEHDAGWYWNSPEYQENQVNYYYTSYDIQVFDNKNVNLSEYASWSINNPACKATSYFTNDNKENKYYICNWDVLNNNQDVSNYEGNNRQIFWYNGNVVVRMYLYWGTQLTDEQISKLSQQKIIDLLGSLQDNQYKYIDWSNFNIEWPASNELYAAMELCSSDINFGGGGGSQDWSCKTEPVVCPPHGYQTKTCRAYNSETGSYDIQTDQISCSPGMCAGCMIPRYSNDNSGDNICLEYGFRKRFSRGERMKLSGKDFNELESEGINLTITSDNSLLIHLTEDIPDKLGVIVNGMKYGKAGESMIVYAGQEYNIELTEFEYNVKYSLIVNKISYSEDITQQYIDFSVAEPFNAYCDVDGHIYQQKVKDPATGGWAECQNSYECDSNLCSRGQCVEILDMTAYIERFRVRGIQILCKLSNLFSLEGYDTCIANYLPATSSSNETA